MFSHRVSDVVKQTKSGGKTPFKNLSEEAEKNSM